MIVDVKDTSYTVDADTNETPGLGISNSGLIKVSKGGIGMRIVGQPTGTVSGNTVIPYFSRYSNPAVANPVDAYISKSGTTFLFDYITTIILGPTVIEGSIYMVSFFGVEVNYTAQAGDDPEAVLLGIKALIDAETYPDTVTTTAPFFLGANWKLNCTTPGETAPAVIVTLTPAGSYKTIRGYRTSINGRMYSVAQNVAYTYDYPAFPGLSDPLDFNNFVQMPTVPGFAINTVRAFVYDPAYPVQNNLSATGVPVMYDIDNAPIPPSSLGPNDVYLDSDADLIIWGTSFTAGFSELVLIIYT